MKLFKYLLAVTYICIASCSSSDNWHTKDELALILWEIQLSDIIIKQHKSNIKWDSALLSLNQVNALEHVYKKHNTSKTKIRLSYNHYQENPLEFEALMSTINHLADTTMNQQPLK